MGGPFVVRRNVGRQGRKRTPGESLAAPVPLAQALVAVLMVFLPLAGCLGGTPVPGAEPPDDFRVPVRQISISYPDGSGGYLRIGAPVDVFDGFGQMHEALPVATRGLSPPNDPVEYVAYWDPVRTAFVRLGSAYAYEAEHDVFVPREPMAYLFMLGLRAGKLPVSGTPTIVQGAHIQWEAQVEATADERTVLIRSESTGGGQTVIRFAYGHDTMIPINYDVLQWNSRFALDAVVGPSGIPTATVGHVVFEDHAQTVSLADGGGAADGFSIPGVPSFRYESADGYFHGPGPLDQSLAPFRLHDALSLAVNHSEVGAFLATTQDAFLLHAQRTFTLESSGLYGRYLWVITIGEGCAGPEKAPAREAVKVEVEWVDNGMQLPPLVTQTSTGPCVVGRGENMFAAWDAMPEAWVSIDSLVAAHQPTGQPLVIEPAAAFRLTARASCYEGSNWRILAGFDVAAENQTEWFSLVNGQRVFGATPMHSDLLSSPLLPLECAPSALPGTY